MVLQVAVNGDRSKADHPAVPVTAEELARDARECLAAGAQEFHVHVRDGVGHPTLEPGCGEAQGDAADAIPMVGEIHEILDRAGLRAPRLQHGDGALTWVLIEDAARRGPDTRVGLEDTLYPRPRLATAVISAAFLSMLAALSGCGLLSGSASSSTSADPPAPATVHSAVHSPAGAAAFSFTITGDRPVSPNGSQDTYTPGVSCASTTLASDHALGVRVARGFGLTGFPAAAALLTHFLQGKGTAVDYRAGSEISKKARASSAFLTADNEVQAVILGQLKAGRTHVRLSAAQLPEVAFETRTSDLYWGFRGTQGLAVTGSGHRAHGRYTGTLTYVIRDSYGFPVGDTLGGFGAPMRYLQTACGAPQHTGGARWFPDTITVTVPFSHPA